MARKPNPDSIKESKIFQLWIKGLKPNTRSVYSHYLAKLLRAADITPEQVLQEAKKDLSNLWRTIKPHANTIQSAKGRYTALYALRRFLIDNGFEDLPRARIVKPRRTKPQTYLTWDQALAICAAASRPYNLLFKLMLHCGWGIGELLYFNSEETWDRVRSYLASNPSAEYFRQDFPPRKSNPEGFYSLVPTMILREIMGLGIPLPLRSKGRVVQGIQNEGVPLDTKHYHTAGEYTGSAWRTALHRAAVTVQGEPTQHDLRDTFRTRAEFVACSGSAAEFAMGHQIDPLEYNKCFHDERWVWNELKKIYGPTAVTEERIETLEKRLTKAVIEQPNVPNETRAEMLLKITKIADSFLRGEGPKIGKAELAEVRDVSGKLKQFADILANGDELTERGELELMVYEQKAREISAKLYEQMRAPEKGSKTRKLDFDKIVKPPKKRAPRYEKNKP